MDKFSYLSNADVNAYEELFQQYKKDPESVEFGWRKFFEGFEFSKSNYEAEIPGKFEKEFKVKELITGYRTRGHLFTKTNPVRTRRQYTDTISIGYYGLTEEDLEQEFQAGNEIGLGVAKLKDIIKFLDQTYCQSVGVEYIFHRKPEIFDWFVNRVEKNRNTPNFTETQKKRILEKLNQAVVFESFLHKKFVGQKRFSLEGGESIIPALDALVEFGAEQGVKEFVVGMAHRGRLNVLANIFGKPYQDIFSEFQSKEYEDAYFDGDVKYHLGISADIKTIGGNKAKLTLSPNPSHLEAVGPVVEGITRAKIDNYLKDSSKVMPVLIHGDAAIAGQGVVYEVIQMAQLKGYSSGGTIHIIINNQIGFTTNYEDGRSSTYCTDIGKVTLSPIFHVNGDDPEALVHTMNMAVEYRQKYKSDVFIDLLCYRKYGHNEGDEPRFTQPLLYEKIAKHSNPRDIYLKKLQEEGVVSESDLNTMEQSFNDHLQEQLIGSKEVQWSVVRDFLSDTWQAFDGLEKEDPFTDFNTEISETKLLDLVQKINHLPPDIKFFKKIVKLFASRNAMVEGNKIDWAMGELLAYAALLDDGYHVRVSGQDVERGTFSHRHAVVTIQDSEEQYIPLQNISEGQGNFNIYNSLLSEYGVLGFDYGYALASPNSLVLWEAQFGDFNNGAQIILDQFLSAAEDKWKSMNGLVMLLPHGFEGQGAEHSSGRIERFLQLCAEENIYVTNCTTPANFFHVLRRQLKRNTRKPLIVFTPKSLLRHPKCVSTVDDFASKGFQDIIDDARVQSNKVRKLVLLSGKLYYDVLAELEAKNVEDVALVRLEQLYPLNISKIEGIVDKYKGAKLIWAQEEPENMGAWSFILRNLRHLDLKLVSRRSSGSPASGSMEVYKRRQKSLIERILQ
jgi:2-oxoglutarate dehydrogenase E1 component